MSNFEKLKLLAITGGVPKHLEEINPRETADDNVRRLCFTKGGYLYEDFERIFNDIFNFRTKTYKLILQQLIGSRLSSLEIAKKVGIQQGGDLLIIFRLKGLFQWASLETLVNWDTICGFQFENLVLKELPLIVARLQLNYSRILSASPFFQRETNRTQSCQIDLLISCKNNTHYVCEMKFRKNIGMETIKEMEEKLKRLHVPRHHSKRPVLIYTGGISQEVIDADYFDVIINVEDFFNEH